ncbi:phosphoglycerate mutase, putative [Perkinsus marinus ATCC 50983]|uniref:Phosphoglycerate mutase, putative n=1 Tax=Perkinsus marinus (strain ATCC 50983 / TXsc) TaxID=423536 RepID=C5LXK8_PERM5|nr:phosphoglycerate mutase, putative [Perkinsus marinus ATCC 50983]EEQ98530.1 phosphoglycerate mutase, putative [Perkinsus marinus ATCC 50983]|eukprot:XP_002765813.1 phosphoglycerate mutase, putative [Perkinsus marinus ATCC 50983]
MGNIDEHTYSQIPDWKVPLTGEGRLEARCAGEQIKKLVKRAVFYVSPYRRTVETYEEIAKTIGLDRVVSVRSEPRIREQDFGNFQCPTEMLKCKQERERFGRFFYRFPHGESGADVYDRVTTFLESMKRHWSDPARRRSRAPRPRTRSDVFAGHLCYTEDSDVVIVTHGVTLRIFLMRWFNWTVDLFEETYNPHNCDVVVRQKLKMVMVRDEEGHYQLTEESLNLLGLTDRVLKNASNTMIGMRYNGSGQLCCYNPARIGSWECFPDSDDAGEDSVEEESSQQANA